jgi:hypothetical protein
MNANQFVKQHGIQQAKNLLTMLKNLGCADDMKFTVVNGMWQRSSEGFTYDELDQVVQSHVVIPPVDMRKEFEPFFAKQPFFNSLKYQHGDRLFDFDQGIGYRNPTVQVDYVCFCKGDREFVLND